MLEYVLEGLKEAGWIIYPLMFASVLGWYLVFRKLFSLAFLNWPGYRLWQERLRKVDWENDFLKMNPKFRRTAVGQTLTAVYSARHNGMKDMQNKLDETMKSLIPDLDSSSSTLAILAAAAPLTGLLGTVDGIIHTFKIISIFGTGNTALMSDSISEALLATQNGLLCAFPLMIMQVLLANKASSIEKEALAAGSALMNRIEGGTP